MANKHLSNIITIKMQETDRNYNEEHEYAAAMKSAIYEQHMMDN